MKEAEGEINSETTIQVIQSEKKLSKYLLKPITGKQHQLRIHMMSLGIPILNDPFYPILLPCKGEDYSHPLQLLAKSIEFTDPFSGQLLNFQSLQNLTFSLET